MNVQANLRSRLLVSAVAVLVGGLSYPAFAGDPVKTRTEYDRPGRQIDEGAPETTPVKNSAMAPKQFRRPATPQKFDGPDKPVKTRGTYRLPGRELDRDKAETKPRHTSRSTSNAHADRACARNEGRVNHPAFVAVRARRFERIEPAQQRRRRWSTYRLPAIARSASRSKISMQSRSCFDDAASSPLAQLLVHALSRCADKVAELLLGQPQVDPDSGAAFDPMIFGEPEQLLR